MNYFWNIAIRLIKLKGLEINEVEEIAEKEYEDDNEPTAWSLSKRTQRVQVTILKKLPKKKPYKKKSKNSIMRQE
jgi:hypothetical protein